MGFFDFLKSERKKKNDLFKNISQYMFPKGEVDIKAGVTEFLEIFDQTLKQNEAKALFLKTVYLNSVMDNYN